MNVRIPQPRIPNIALPAIRNLPTLPHVGCGPGGGDSYLGEQFGNLPDLNALLHLRSLRKALNEQIYALIEGEAPQPARAPVYAARAAQLADEVAEMLAKINEIVGGVTGSVTDAINYANQQLAAVNAAKNTIAAVPATARSAAQKLMFERYGRYAQEINAQVGRLQSTLDCIDS